MKKIFNLIVWIGSLSILLLSCSNDETENDKKPDDNNMVTVSLAMTGDILEVEETPLSKAVETADIYGIQIYSSPKDEDNYQHYGYGIFLDKSKMQVKLFKDRKYKFEMTVFPDGEIENNEYRKFVLTGYKGPFYNHANITDSINYSDNEELGQLGQSYVNIINGYGGYDTWAHPLIDRYYGKLTNYVPTENSTVNIDLKRVVAGLTFKVKGLTNQSALKIEIDRSPTIEIKGDGATDEMTCNVLMCLIGEYVEQFHQPHYTDKWFENPINKVSFKFTWTNGERTESFTQTVTMKRKMNYTFQITIPETFLVSNGITVTEEDKTWDDDVIVDIYFDDLIIKNEEDLEAFRNARYTKVTGNLTVSDLTMEYLNNAFNYLQTVDGNLTVSNVNSNLEGEFGNLRYVGGDLKLLATKESTMNKVYSFKYLHELQKIGGNFEISSTKISSFINLSMIHTPSLVHVGGDIILKNLPILKNYCNLKTVLQNHTGQFIISGNAYNPTKEQILAGECYQPQ